MLGCSLSATTTHWLTCLRRDSHLIFLPFASALQATMACLSATFSALVRVAASAAPLARIVVMRHVNRTIMNRGMRLILVLTLAQIIIRRPWGRSFRNVLDRIELLFTHDDDAAVGAHPQGVEPLVANGVHPMPALELGRDPVDRALHAERRAAADA